MTRATKAVWASVGAAVVMTVLWVVVWVFWLPYVVYTFAEINLKMARRFILKMREIYDDDTNG